MNMDFEAPASVSNASFTNSHSSTHPTSFSNPYSGFSGNAGFSGSPAQFGSPEINAISTTQAFSIDRLNTDRMGFENSALPFSVGLDITVAFLTVLYIVHLLNQLRPRSGEPLFARIDSSFLQARKRCLVDQRVASRS